MGQWNNRIASNTMTCCHNQVTSILFPLWEKISARSWQEHLRTVVTEFNGLEVTCWNVKYSYVLLYALEKKKICQRKSILQGFVTSKWGPLISTVCLFSQEALSWECLFGLRWRLKSVRPTSPDKCSAKQQLCVPTHHICVFAFVYVCMCFCVIWPFKY